MGDMRTAVAPEPKEAAKERIVNALMRKDGLAGIAIFKKSPLQDRRMSEISLLQKFALSALESGIKLEDVGIKSDECKDVGGWAAYLKKHAPDAPGMAEHLRVDDSGCLRASPKLAAFIRERITIVVGETGI